MITSFGIILLFSQCSVAQSEQTAPPTSKDLQKEIQEITQRYHANIGVSVVSLEDGGDSFTLNDTAHCPTMSVYKFPLALAVLQKVDAKKLKLDQKIHVTKGMLHSGTWSPFRDEHPQGNVDVTIEELLTYTVSRSDNNTTDILFDLVGGTAKVQQFVQRLGIKDMMIAATEYQMGEEGKVYANWSTPSAMTQLLKQFHEEKILSKENTDFLVKLMTESPTGKNRLKGLLPHTAIVAHKTGTGGQGDNGKSAIVNDVGIVTLPNGKHLAIAVFINYSSESFETNEYIISRLMATVWEFYTHSTEIGMRTVELFDESRQRAIPLKVYESLALDNQKVVILSGGYLSRNDEYGFIARRLASKGYLVVSIQHDLPGDEPLAKEGNIVELRTPIWKRADTTIQYVKKVLTSMYPNRTFERLVLVGHSNGGDMSLYFSEKHPKWVSHIITLDHRRKPIPPNTWPKVLSLRASDFEADPGVLPSAEAQEMYGIKIVNLGENAKHGDLCDSGSEELKQRILKEIDLFLK